MTIPTPVTDDVATAPEDKLLKSNSFLLSSHTRDEQIDFVITRMITDRIGLHSITITTTYT